MLIILLIVLTGSAYGQTEKKKPEEMIRRYWFVLLTEGKNRDQDSATAAAIQIAHLDNIRRLYREGKVKVAGPFGEDNNPATAGWQGLFVFDAASQEEVEKLLQSDAAIKAGRMVYQIKPWYTIPTGSFVPGKPKEDLF